MNRTMKYQGAFSRIVGFAGKRFLFSPPPPPSNFFSPSNFRPISRLETLATQAMRQDLRFTLLILVYYTKMDAVSLFWDTVANVTSYQNALFLTALTD